MHPRNFENKSLTPSWATKTTKRSSAPAVDAKRQQAVATALRRAHIKTLVDEAQRDLANIRLREEAKALALQLRAEDARRRGEAWSRVNG
jgi:hypothetical protein